MSELVNVGGGSELEALAGNGGPLPAARNPAVVYVARLAPGSRQTMMGALEKLARQASTGRLGAADLPWHALRYQHTQALRAWAADRHAPATANKLLSALRGALREAWRLGLIDSESYHRAADLAPVRGVTLPTGRGLSQQELGALFNVCCADQGPAGMRDAALLAIGYAGGLRVAELCALDRADYDRETGCLMVRAGKGRKDRTAYASNGARDALEAWLSIRGDVDGPLFNRINRGGRIEAGSRMYRSSVNARLRRRAQEAGVARFSPHDLRRSFISDALDSGADLATVQKLAGHANPATTARYDRRGEATKRRAAELLRVPFNR